MWRANINFDKQNKDVVYRYNGFASPGTKDMTLEQVHQIAKRDNFLWQVYQLFKHAHASIPYYELVMAMTILEQEKYKALRVIEPVLTKCETLYQAAIEKEIARCDSDFQWLRNKEMIQEIVKEMETLF